jgi:hypothetical protein
MARLPHPKLTITSEKGVETPQKRGNPYLEFLVNKCKDN